MRSCLKRFPCPYNVCKKDIIIINESRDRTQKGLRLLDAIIRSFSVPCFQYFYSYLSCYVGLQALFFDIVESGLNDRFKVDDIPRVFKFCQYAKSEIPAPSPKVMKVQSHSCCVHMIYLFIFSAGWRFL